MESDEGIGPRAGEAGPDSRSRRLVCPGRPAAVRHLAGDDDWPRQL